MSQPLFLGKDLGVQRYDIIKYPVFKGLDNKQMMNFWRPEEIELKKDRGDFQNLTDNEKFIFTSNLKYQTMLDSVICRGVPTLLEYVTNTELEACMMTWQFFEKIHSQSYSYIIQNVYADSSEVFGGIYEDKEIMKRANSAISDYNKAIELKPDYAVAYNNRGATKRNLEDNYGGRMIRVRGHAKIMTHLMFGIIAITANQLFKAI